MGDVHQIVEDIYRAESRAVFAMLIRMIGDFDLAEDAMAEAYAAAVERWAADGVPANPRAWLVSTARFKAIDAIRRKARFDGSIEKLALRMDGAADPFDGLDEARFRDDQLRLIFTCCHPALAQEVQVALTLRELCGLTTEEVASAFLTSKSAIAQRIVRGKAKIREARIPYEVPAVADLPARLDSVLSVIYLVFNEGYSASSGEAVTRADLCAEAIRLGRVLLELLAEAEVMGLLALMLLHDSRRASRSDTEGNLILLGDQDRRLWNREQIAEGRQLVDRALATAGFGVYTIQAAISAVHSEAPSSEETPWGQVVALYDVLLQLHPSPVIELNRAVAVAMRDGAAAGLRLVEQILERGDLRDYHFAHAARADFHRRLGQTSSAIEAYETALRLTNQAPERRFIEGRLRALQSA